MLIIQKDSMCQNQNIGGEKKWSNYIRGIKKHKWAILVILSYYFIHIIILIKILIDVFFKL